MLTNQEIKRAMKRMLIIFGVYVVFSLIAGAASVSVGLPFAAGFVWAALCAAGLYYVIKYE